MSVYTMQLGDSLTLDTEEFGTTDLTVAAFGIGQMLIAINAVPALVDTARDAENSVNAPGQAVNVYYDSMTNMIQQLEVVGTLI